MKCPICSKEMLHGYFNDDQSPIQWIPNGKKPPFFNYTTAKDGVRLYNKFSMLKGYTAEAYYCDNCHIVIANTEK